MGNYAQRTTSDGNRRLSGRTSRPNRAGQPLHDARSLLMARFEASSGRIDRRRYRPVGVPAELHSCADGFAPNIGDALPLGEAGFTPTRTQEDIAGIVLGLLDGRCPPAISGLVVPIIVDAINARSG